MSWPNIIGRALVKSRFAPVVSLQELCYKSIYGYLIVSLCCTSSAIKLLVREFRGFCNCLLGGGLQLLARWRSVHNWPLTGVCSLLAALRRTLGRPHHHRHPPPATNASAQGSRQYTNLKGHCIARNSITTLTLPFVPLLFCLWDLIVIMTSPIATHSSKWEFIFPGQGTKLGTLESTCICMN